MQDESLSTADLAKARALLGKLGYRIQIQQREWWECRVSSSHEDWLARGNDADAAFARALALLYPSRAARLALDEQLRAGEIGELTTERPLVTRQPEEATRLDLTLDATTLEFRIPSESEDTRPPAPALDVLRELELLRARVLGAGPTLASQPAALQRLHLLRAAAVARALEEFAPDSKEVKHGAEAVIGMLRRMADSFKPGEVRTLSLAVRPNDCAADLPAGSAVPRTWRELATLATQAISAAARR